MDASVDARRLALPVAWLVVGATYALGGVSLAAGRWWGTLGAAVLLLLLAALTLRAEADVPATNGRRWRLGWDLGAFHVASCALVGATSGWGFSVFVALDASSHPLRAEFLVPRIALLAACILLTALALRPRDLDGRGVEGILGVRALGAGAVFGAVALATIGFLPSALTIAVPTGALWALAYWVLDTVLAGLVAPRRARHFARVPP
jgi:hypothetical protein